MIKDRLRKSAMWQKFKAKIWKILHEHPLFRARQSETYCPLPFMHMSVAPSYNLRVCCNGGFDALARDPEGRYTLFDEIQSVDEHMNSPFMKNIRRKMLRGEKPEACKKCWDHEKAGSRSYRQLFEVQFASMTRKLLNQTDRDGTLHGGIRYLDFAMGNNCNIQCRMCNPTSSSKLAQEFDQIKVPYCSISYEDAKRAWKVDEHYDQILEELLETAELILMTGGEPFVTQAQYRLIEKTIESGRAGEITLSYHTNLTVVPDRLKELWSHFKMIKVHGSMEAVGPLNDYVRYPSKWETVDKNLKKILKLKEELPIWFEVHTVFQAYTLSHLPELFQYLLQYHEQFPSFPFLNYLYEPAYLRTNILPREYRLRYFDQLENLIEKNKPIYFREGSPYARHNQLMYENFSGFRELMIKDEEENYPEFLRYSRSMDGLRGQSIEQVLPELFQKRIPNLSI